MAGGFLHVDVLAGLTGEDGSQGMPVVGRAHDDRIHALVVQHAAEVLDHFGPFTCDVFDSLGSILEEPRVDIGQVGDLRVAALGKTPGHAVSPPADSHESQHDPFAGAGRAQPAP